MRKLTLISRASEESKKGGSAREGCPSLDSKEKGRKEGRKEGRNESGVPRRSFLEVLEETKNEGSTRDGCFSLVSKEGRKEVRRSFLEVVAF